MFLSPKFLTIMAAATKTIRHYSVSSSSSRPLSISPTRLLLSSSFCSSTVQFPRFSFTRPTSISVRGFSTPPSSSSHFTHPSDDDDDDSPPTPNSMGGCDWTSPLRVSGIGPEAIRARPNYGGEGGDGHHWLVVIELSGFEFDTEQKLFDYYIRILATVVGSEEAKKKIYLVSCAWRFGFGAEIDEDTKYKLEVLPGVAVVLEDYYYDARNKDSGVRSVTLFTPINQNYRLNDIFSYHYLSVSHPEWNSDHWLIHIKQPNDEFRAEQQTIDFCIQMLSDVIGSKVDAQEKIYIVWCKTPFGFGAEIDKDTSNKLKGLPDVLTVLPDYAFDVKNKNRGVLVISPSCCFKSCANKIHYSPMIEEHDSEYSEDSEDSEDYDDPKEDLFGESGCKHWFISMETIDGESGSMQQMIDCYIETLAIVVGSEEEAREKIYRISFDEREYGFAAEIDEDTSYKLNSVQGVLIVSPDYYVFMKDHKSGYLFTIGHRVQSFLREFGDGPKIINGPRFPANQLPFGYRDM